MISPHAPAPGNRWSRTTCTDSAQQTVMAECFPTTKDVLSHLLVKSDGDGLCFSPRDLGMDGLEKNIWIFERLFPQNTKLHKVPKG